MKTFKSIYNYKLYLVLILVSMIPAGFGILGVWGLLKNLTNNEPFRQWGFTILMPIICFGYVYAAIRHFYRLSPKVTISDGEICIGSITIRTDQVKLVTVRGKTHGNLLFMFYAYESCSVLLDNGQEYSIAVENYLNGNVIRMNFDRLNRFVLGKSVKFSVVETDEEYQFGNELSDTRTAIKYMQSPFKSFNNYVFGGICLGAIWMMVQMKYTSLFVVLFPVGIFALFYFILVLQNHYFLLTDTHLVVRRLFLPAWQRVFRLDHIDHMESEDDPRAEMVIKLMTKNFGIYRFQSGLMNEEMFHDLIQAVNSRQAESGQNRS